MIIEEETIEVEEKDKGFTLVELLIVIVILGILATIVVFAVRGITDKGQKSACAATEDAPGRHRGVLRHSTPVAAIPGGTREQTARERWPASVRFRRTTTSAATGGVHPPSRHSVRLIVNLTNTLRAGALR